jgi:SAM-dependent MidA family methyltransferase
MSFLTYFQQQWLKMGAVPFVSFMHDALYAPNLGYYSGGNSILGRTGDFVTAPLLTPLFGQTLAEQCRDILVETDDAIIFEFGAGTGRLCVDMLKHLQQLGCLPHEYHILEVSGHLRARQQALIAKEIPALFPRVKWLSQWPVDPFRGVIIANEVLDAMPIHRFLLSANGYLESYIGLDSLNQLHEQFRPCENGALTTYLDMALPNLNAPYLSEVNLFLKDWFKQCFAMLSSGVMLIIDYGFPRHEYYHPDRNQGTLMCHYQHTAHTDILAHPGEQDITAHVDFTCVAECAFDAGFQVAGYTNQATFLLNCGLLDLLHQQSALQDKQAVKQLIQPQEMGELFKVIALTKQFEIPLKGFQLNDKRASL